MTQVPRKTVYEVIDSERAYQEALKLEAYGAHNMDRHHELDAFVLYMDGYMGEAKQIAAFDWSPEAKWRTLASIRKVAALAVACMEIHGAPFRVMPDAEGIRERVDEAK